LKPDESLKRVKAQSNNGMRPTADKAALIIGNHSERRRALYECYAGVACDDVR
jgi:hypothetical protein